MVKEIVEQLNDILKKYGIKELIGLSDIIITRNAITDNALENPKLSNLIIDHLWTPIHEIDLFHYTSKNAAEEISATGYFRLYSLLKRFGEGEIVAFCEAHGLDGYLERSGEGGSPYYQKSMMQNLFYASFAGRDVSSEQDTHLRSLFGRGEPRRLLFHIKAINPNLRKMYYGGNETKPIPLLGELSMLAGKFNKKFYFAGISMLCAFYLANSLAVENEYRIAFKKWDGYGPEVKNGEWGEYVEIELDQMDQTGYEIKLLGIEE